jgi:hypothetical protein
MPTDAGNVCFLGYFRSPVSESSGPVLTHYPDFPSLENAFPALPGVVGLGLRHDSRTWHYRFSGPGLRAIGNRQPPVKGRERVVSYDRSETVVGESIHISAIERLGCHAPFRSSSKTILYAPPNLLAALPDLYARYCLPQTRSWGPEALSFTVWSGEIVHESKSDDAIRSIARQSILSACERLKSNGITVHVDDRISPAT